MLKRLFLLAALACPSLAIAAPQLTPKEQALQDRDNAMRGYKPSAAEIRRKERENDFRRVDTREKRNKVVSQRQRAGKKLGRRL